MLITLTSLLVVALVLPASGTGIAGRARVSDGDSIEVAGERVRLFGIDAPELKQTCRRAAGAPYPCGDEARAFLRQLAEGQQVTCQDRGRDRYGRMLATCSRGSLDLGAAMVSAGQAVTFRGSGMYDADEAKARAARLGLWSGTFEQPADWRREHPR